METKGRVVDVVEFDVVVRFEADLIKFFEQEAQMIGYSVQKYIQLVMEGFADEFELAAGVEMLRQEAEAAKVVKQ